MSKDPKPNPNSAPKDRQAAAVRVRRLVMEYFKIPERNNVRVIRAAIKVCRPKDGAR